ncbi:MAG: recombinase family protein [Clostridia bacterium]|nr:recombinase family protein [Clostridia bacterium]
MILTNRQSDKVGIYLRLSRDDGDKIESDSIHSQRQLIKDFIGRHPAFRYKKEYVDDGYTGTNFDRPDFVRLMEDVRKGIINCVIVKDLSRLGRNYIETGRYIERIFPSLGLRLVAINDNYDSLDKNSSDNEIIVPFKNLINDAYCRDISLKIRSHLDVKRRDGQFIGSFAMFGYEKDEKNKNHLVIDEDAAKTVEQIFELRMNGYSAQRIAEKLDELGLQPPYEYKRKRGLNYNSGFKSADKPTWKRETVMRILNSEMYTGTMVQGKSKRINYKIKKSLPVEPADWMIVNNTHDPIIKKDTFELIQGLSELDTRVSPERSEVYPLCGFIKCGGCGQNMVRRATTRCGKKYYYYHCSTYKAGGNCTSHLISCKKLDEIVFLAFKRQIELLDKAEDMISFISNDSGDRSGIRLIRDQKKKLMDEIDRYGELIAKLYRDMVEGLIDRKQFEEINGRFDKSRSKVEESLRSVEQREQVLINNQLRFQPWVENLMRYRDVTELSRSAVISTIDRIVVKESDDIEVHFKFEEELSELTKYMEEKEDKRYDMRQLYEKSG